MPTTHLRQTLVAVSVALMLVVAGCNGSRSTGQFYSDTSTANYVASPHSTTLETTTRPTTPVETTSRTNTSVKLVSLKRAPQSKIKEINESLKGFYGGLTKEQVQPKAVAAIAAKRTCSNLSKINRSLLVDPSNTQKASRILSHATEILNSNYDSVHVSPRRLRRVANGAGTLAKYTTLIGPWNAYYEASCRFDRNDPESVENYYISTGALVFELSMMQYQVYYKTSFKAVNIASHSRAYRTIHSTFGDDVFGLSMSISHWAARETLESVPLFVREKAVELNISVNGSTTNVNQIRGQFGPSLASSWNQSTQAKDEVTKLVKSCYEETKSKDSGGGLFGDLLSSGEKIVSDTFSEDYNVSDALEDLDGVDATEVSDRTMNQIGKCVSEEKSAKE